MLTLLLALYQSIWHRDSTNLLAKHITILLWEMRYYTLIR